jgi:hypothetical protein
MVYSQSRVEGAEVCVYAGVFIIWQVVNLLRRMIFI